MKRIHIVGTGPRTGTTLMAEALIACYAIDEHTSHEDRIFARPRGRPDVYLTKAPQDVMVVGPILRLDPRLWVICMVRDPRDSLTSRHGLDPTRYWAGLWFWRTYARYARRLLDHPRFILVRYEELVDDPDAVQARLEERMPFLRRTAPFARYHELATPSGGSLHALGRVRPFDASSIGRWRNHRERLAGQLALHGPLTDDLVEWGYEEDDAWLRELDGVEPDTSPSHLKEHGGPARERRHRRGLGRELALLLLWRLTGLDLKKMYLDLRRRVGRLVRRRGR